MKFYTRKIVKPEDLNSHSSLFGGRVLEWVDEEAAIFALCQLETTDIVTKFISEINFVNSAYLGDIIEIGVDTISIGNTSITLQCEVRDKSTKKTLVTVDRIVFVCVDKYGKPKAHGKILNSLL